jgi:hypothetical protein
MDEARGNRMANKPQMNITAPKNIDQPFAFFTAPKDVSEFILSSFV